MYRVCGYVSELRALVIPLIRAVIALTLCAQSLSLSLLFALYAHIRCCFKFSIHVRFSARLFIKYKATVALDSDGIIGTHRSRCCFSNSICQTR